MTLAAVRSGARVRIVSGAAPGGHASKEHDERMASFTFRSGNARKVLSLPLYALGALASLAAPRDDRLWVFGCGIGLAEGALPLYRHARRVLPPGHRLVWLASTPAERDEARAHGVRSELKSGWRGFRLTLRARTAIVTHGFGDVNRFGLRGAFVVQLWHGIPLKRLHLDSPEVMNVSFLPGIAPVRALLRSAYRRAGRQIDLFPVASRIAGERIRSAFGLRPGVVRVTGDPRDDVLLAGEPRQRRARARARVEKATGAPLGDARVVLYAPTWRDGDTDPGIPDPAEWGAIARWLEQHDAVLLVRPHPLGAGDYARGPATSDRIRDLGPRLLRDVMAALPAVDALVTDYSSIAFDFALLERPIVFFAPDAEAYAARRGLYESYERFSGGGGVRRWHEVLARLDGALSGTDPRAAAAATELGRRYHEFRDGHNTERVLAALLDALGEHAPARS